MKESENKLVKNIKPIINGYYYCRTKNEKPNTFKGGYIAPKNNFVSSFDNNSLIKSNIIMVKI